MGGVGDSRDPCTNKSYNCWATFNSYFNEIENKSNLTHPKLQHRLTKLHLGDWQIYCALMLKCHLIVCNTLNFQGHWIDIISKSIYTCLYVPMSKYNLREYNFTVYDNIPLYWVSRLVVLMVCCYSQILHWIERSPLAFCSLNPGAKFFEKCDKSFKITKKNHTSKYVTKKFTQCGFVWINSNGQVILHVTDYYSLY